MHTALYPDFFTLDWWIRDQATVPWGGSPPSAAGASAVETSESVVSLVEERWEEACSFFLGS